MPPEVKITAPTAISTVVREDVKQGPHTKTLPPNKNGVDVVLTDLHGVKTPLEQLLVPLNGNDRVIIPGDFIDRGPDSFELCKLIIENNLKHNANNKAGVLPSKNTPFIFVTRGNHEDDFIAMYQEMYGHGGQGKSSQLYQAALKDPHKRWIGKLNADELGTLAAFFIKLPYIIRVEGDAENRPYCVVHASMPFSDEEFFKCDRAKRQLSENEIRAATCARTPEKAKTGELVIKSNGRDEKSTLAICGHNAHHTMDHTKMIRSNINTMIFDVGTPTTGVALAVLPNECAVIPLGKPTKPEHFANARKAIPDLEAHLQKTHPKPEATPPLPERVESLKPRSVLRGMLRGLIHSPRKSLSAAKPASPAAADEKRPTTPRLHPAA